MPRQPVDLAAVRASRRRLQQIAKEHPELTGPSGPKNRAGWEAALEEVERMTNSDVVSMRVPPALLKRIDRHGQKMSQAAGVPISRAVVAKKLIEIGLAQVEAPEPKKKK